MTKESPSDHVNGPLRGSDVLAHADLCSADERGGPSGVIRQTGVRCGRPLIYPVPPDDLPTPLRRRAAATGCGYYGALFAFDLDELPPGHRYTAARFEVSLSDPCAVAAQLHGDGGALGLAYGFGAPLPVSATAVRALAASGARPGWLGLLAPRSGHARAWVSGAQSHEFSWSYDDPRGEVLMPRTYGMHALIELPPGSVELGGALGVHVGIAGMRRDSRMRHDASPREVVRFAEPLAAVVGAAAGTTAAVRLCMAVDVSGYSAQPNTVAERTQRRLVDVLARARRHAGLDESAISPQAQGDGQFAVLPAGIDESMVIPCLVQGLDSALREANRDLGAQERVRLRVALHRGLVKEGDNGWIGNAAIGVHRILDSPPVRAALREHIAADFVLGLPDVLFHDVVVHSSQPPRPEEFQEITVDLPDKNFLEHAWLYVAISRGP